MSDETPLPPPPVERRRLPDPVTLRFLLTWAVGLPIGWWAAHKLFPDHLAVNGARLFSITPFGRVCVFLAATVWAVVVSCAFYKVKFGKFHLWSVLRVVRGILSLFLVVMVFFWPVSMMIIALNPRDTLPLIGLTAGGVAALSVFIRLARPPEKGFWRDWVNDTLLRW